MATNAQAVATSGARELLKGINLFKADPAESVANKLVGGRLIKDTRSFIKVATRTGPGLPTHMDEFDAFPESQYADLDTATFTASKDGLKLRFSREAWDDNQFPDFMRSYGADMREMFDERREIDVQNAHFNNVASNTCPNGDYYADADIDLDDEAAEILGTATYSNIMASPETPSPDMYDQLSQILLDERTQKGTIRNLRPPFDVFTDRKWYQTWVTMKASTEIAGQVEHGKNWVNGMIRDIVVVPYSTHEDYTRIQTTKQNRAHNFIWDREMFDLNPLRYDDDNDSMVASAISRRVTDSFHQAGTAFSLAGS